MDWLAVRALRALVTAAHRAAALHHPPRPFLGRTSQTRMLPPGVRALRRRSPFWGAGDSHLLGQCAGAVFALALLVAVCVPGSLGAQTPTRPPRPRPLNAGDVEVTPDGDPLVVAPGSGGTALFTIFNNTNATVSYTLTCDVSGVVTSCGIDEDEVTLSPFETLEDVPVSYATSSSVGDGSLSMTATGIFTDDGSYTVTTAHPSAATVTQPRQPDSVFNRGHCVTSSAGIADWSCGDALFMLSTPSFTTLDRARNLTLTYASATASPQPLVAVNVSLGSGGPALTAIRVILTVHDTIRTTVTYSPWDTGVHQLVVGLERRQRTDGRVPLHARRVRACRERLGGEQRLRKSHAGQPHQQPVRRGLGMARGRAAGA